MTSSLFVVVNKLEMRFTIQNTKKNNVVEFWETP